MEGQRLPIARIVRGGQLVRQQQAEVRIHRPRDVRLQANPARLAAPGVGAQVDDHALAPLQVHFLVHLPRQPQVDLARQSRPRHHVRRAGIPRAVADVETSRAARRWQNRPSQRELTVDERLRLGLQAALVQAPLRRVEV